ncbi:MAG: prepilin-type N-terminal cleavage/methylation domain-containing protein [Candidatus Omnitrophica bacterium]|nr:prepilin-type N-terminal cleavage/methylation domain-containing protein [Candidatus Omnitrophota bacterium]
MKPKGFTLAELLLAAAILAFALTSLLVLFVNCLFLNENNRNTGIAVGHAQYVLEDIKNTAFELMSTRIQNGTWSWSSAVIESHGLTPLRNELIATNCSGTDPLDVRVRVFWQSKGQTAGTKNVTLETLFSR